MITEDYLSFELSKLIKEKGFNWVESPFYSEQDRDEWMRNAQYSIPNPCYDENIPFDSPTLYVTAPHISIQMAMKWLREVHKLHIWIAHKLKQNKGLPWYYEIHNIETGTVVKIGDVVCGSYEAACEAAIRYCLENLI